MSGVITSSPLRNSIRSRDGREIGRVLTCGSGNEREIGRVFTAAERAAAQNAASSLLSPTSHLDAASYSNIDAMSGLNINLACRGEFVVKPQVCSFFFYKTSFNTYRDILLYLSFTPLFSI